MLYCILHTVYCIPTSASLCVIYAVDKTLLNKAKNDIKLLTSLFDWCRVYEVKQNRSVSKVTGCGFNCASVAWDFSPCHYVQIYSGDEALSRSFQE